MSTDTGSVRSDAVPCPDPSAHAKSPHKHTLSEDASTAALLAAKGERPSDARNKAPENILGSDGKLSSKSKPYHFSHVVVWRSVIDVEC